MKQLQCIRKAVCSTLGHGSEIPLEDFSHARVFPDRTPGDGSQKRAVFDRRDSVEQRERRFRDGAFQTKPVHIALDGHLAQWNRMPLPVRSNELPARRSLLEFAHQPGPLLTWYCRGTQ